jgi:mannose-6-phosphate isomerase-like protein (cupin superfamily)
MHKSFIVTTMSIVGLLVNIALLQAAAAQSPKPQVQYVTAAQLAGQVAHTVEGIVSNEIPSGPGSTILIIRRDKSGEVEVHDVMNDIIVVKSGHATITVGGQVTGNHEIKPTEWRGGEVSGGRDYKLAPGDLLFIPAGMPHKVILASKASFTYLTIKIPAKPVAAAP